MSARKKTDQKKKEKYFIERTIPFALKRKLIAIGINILPIEERSDWKIWYADSLEQKKEAEQIIDEYCETYAIDQSSEQESNSKRFIDSQEAISSFLKGIEEEMNNNHGLKINPRLDDNYDWNFLLQNWDSLKAVLAIKEHGLPALSKQRETLLEKLTERNPGTQYNVVYEDLCEYCEDFDAAYGWNTVKKALEDGNITNGFNLSSKVNNSDLPEELKKLLLYVFPSVRRESPQNPYDFSGGEENDEVSIADYIEYRQKDIEKRSHNNKLCDEDLEMEI